MTRFIFVFLGIFVATSLTSCSNGCGGEGTRADVSNPSGFHTFEPRATEAPVAPVRLLVQDDGSEILAGTTSRSSMILKRADDAAPWESVDIAAFETVAAAQSDDGLFVARREGDLIYPYFSSDGGVTWDQRETPNVLNISGVRFELFANRTGTLFLLAEGRGLYRSTDRARNWSQVYPTDVYAETIVDITLSDGTLYLSARGVSSLLRSTDEGATWDEVPTSVQPDTVGVLALPESSLLVHADRGLQGTIWTSDDMGATWSSDALPNAESGVGRFTDFFAHDGSLHALIEREDGVEVVRRESTGGLVSVWSSGELQDRRGAATVVTTDDSARVLYGAGDETVEVTLASGRPTTETFMAPLAETFVRGRQLVASNDELLAFWHNAYRPSFSSAGDLVIMGSSDGGESWEERGTIRAVEPVETLHLADNSDDWVLFATRAPQGTIVVHRTHDGGATIESVDTGVGRDPNEFPRSLWHISGSSWVVQYDDNRLLYSDDDGMTWEPGYGPGLLTLVGDRIVWLDEDGILSTATEPDGTIETVETGLRPSLQLRQSGVPSRPSLPYLTAINGSAWVVRRADGEGMVTRVDLDGTWDLVDRAENRYPTLLIPNGSGLLQLGTRRMEGFLDEPDLFEPYARVSEDGGKTWSFKAIGLPPELDEDARVTAALQTESEVVIIFEDADFGAGYVARYPR